VSLASFLRSFQVLDRELKKRIMIVVKNAMMIVSEIMVVKFVNVLVASFLCYDLLSNPVFELRR